MLEVRVQVPGVGYVLEGALEEFSAGVADDLAQLLVDPEPAAVGDTDRGLLEGGPEARLALLEGLLGPLALCDVERDASLGDTKRSCREGLAASAGTTAAEAQYAADGAVGP